MKKLQFLAKTAFSVLAISAMLTFSSCKDECKDVTCNNGGTCVEGTCDCATGFEGTSCDTEIRAKFQGTWTASDNCSLSGSDSYVVTSTDGTSIMDVNLTNFWGVFNNPVKASINGNTITIASQAPDNDGYFVSGTGTLTGSTISWSYTITNQNVTPNVSDVCTSSWTK